MKNTPGACKEKDKATPAGICFSPTRPSSSGHLSPAFCMGFGMPDSRINTLLVTEWVAMPLQCQGVAQPHGFYSMLNAEPFLTGSSNRTCLKDNFIFHTQQIKEFHSALKQFSSSPLFFFLFPTSISV